MTDQTLTPKTKSKKVMISSTVRDLPEHREKVMHACLRLGMFYPEMMEHLSATNANSMEISLRMVDMADIYVGIFGFRYGYIPPGQAISVTEIEYNRAAERGIPRLIFLMSEDHPVKPSDVETGEGSEKLKKLKERLKTECVVSFFNSPDDLRANVMQSLSDYREADITAFHYISDIPTPPEAYIAHPYTLLQTHRLVGRKTELNLLTDWVTDSKTFQVSETWKVSILNIVAIGGMGKSALTWKWFNDIAPQEMKLLAGRMWWSFYESDATFENFIIRALAYVTQQTREEVEKILPPDRETRLLTVLDHEPYLLVLDGLERILLAYARMDAAHLQDGNVENKKNLRKTTDPRTGRFLKKLAQIKNSRILISTRLYPAELEIDTGEPIPGCFKCDISGLTDEDAVELWRAFGISGSRDTLLPIFNTFDKHPLLIQALAGEVKRFHRAPGDFEEWRKVNPRFDPARCQKTQDAMAHVLQFALHGLDKNALKVLHTIAAFRMPASYDTLSALFIGEDKLFLADPDLDTALIELEDRGLLGWDKRANRYDLHPIVRGVVWSGLPSKKRNGVFISLQVHFESVPKIDEWQKVDCLEDLTPAIELYNTLIGLGRYDDAEQLFYNRINRALFFRLCANRQRAELLEMLFLDGLDQMPRLSSPTTQVFTLNALAQAYQFSGQPGHAALLFRNSATVIEKENDLENVSVIQCNLSNALRLAGGLRESESTARHALVDGRVRIDRFREAISLYWLGLTLGARGASRESESALRRSLRIFVARSHTQSEGLVNSKLAQHALWLRKPVTVLSFADRAWELAHVERLEFDFIHAARLQGAAVLGLGDFKKADERLHHALTRARAVNLVDEELPTLVTLAELRLRQENHKAARGLLDDVWEYAERGPYPLFHADAFNVLAQIERDAGNSAAAVEAATKAYRLAWCDGPPFAYHWGLVAASKQLLELGAPEPQMPPFNESKYGPMPEVEINPKDDFYVDEKEIEK